MGIITVAAVSAAIFILLSASKSKEGLRKRVLELEKEKSALETRIESQSAYMEGLGKIQQDALDRNREQHLQDMELMKEQFRAAAAEIAEKNTKEFRQQSAERIEDILKPIKEKFVEFDKSVKDSRTESTKQNSALEASIKLIMEQSRQVGNEAKNLADALAGRSKVQGDFGEMLLKDILKNAGLQEGIHFISQGVLTDGNGHEIKSEEGRSMIPDTIIFYPDDTLVVVDSKVSLTAFKNYLAATEVEERARLAKAHVESIRKHVDELKAKDYASYVPEGRRKVTYNIMFIPVEAAFRLMLDEAPMLWQNAKDNNVLIVSQMTLVIVLNMIQMSWKQAAQEENIEAVYRTASELMSQLQNWMSAFVSVGEYLRKASDSYDDSKKKLCDSRQSVIRKIEKLESLGLSPKRSRAKIQVSGRKPGPESVVPKELAGTEE